MARDKGTQSDLLQAVVERLIARITEYSAKNCFVSDEVVPLTFPHGKFLCTVSLGNGTFPEDLYTGGGDNQVTEEIEIVVTWFVQLMQVQADHAERAILHASDGSIRRFKHAILDALLIDRTASDNMWEPLYRTEKFLRDGGLRPSQSSAPKMFTPNDAQNPYCMAALSFAASYDWDLTQQ